jgi:lantibiotic modifying enzyme
VLHAPLPAVGPTLASGSSGIALLFGYLAQVFPARGYESTSIAWLNQAIDQLATAPFHPSLYQGFSGVAWVAEHLRTQVGLPVDEGLHDEIDSVLLDHLEQQPALEDYELIDGLVGLGVYYLERLPDETAVKALGRIIDRLEVSASAMGPGLAWFRPPELLPDWQRELTPEGHFNLGVAHGVPAVLGLLGLLQGQGLGGVRVSALVDRTAAWLLDQELDGGRFPSWTVPGVRAEPCRLGWCYGSPGLILTLYLAAKAAGNEAWERDVFRIAGSIAPIRSQEESEVYDAAICHGAAGLAQVFNRLFYLSGREAYAESARFWVQRTLELEAPHPESPGFLVPCPRQRWAALTDLGLLTGIAGIALALLSFCSDVEPKWDRFLLMS